VCDFTVNFALILRKLLAARGKHDLHLFKDAPLRQLADRGGETNRGVTGEAKAGGGLVVRLEIVQQ
jgi:hypothetical protein